MPSTSRDRPFFSSIRTGPSGSRSSQTVRTSSPATTRFWRLWTRLFEPFVDGVPVDGIPPRGDVVRTTVLVLQVVGVLPDVEAQKRFLAFHQRTVLVRGALDHQLAAGIDQPRPAAAEARRRRLGKLLLEGVEAAE